MSEVRIAGEFLNITGGFEDRPNEVKNKKKRVEIDPGFINAVSSYIKDPCPARAHRKQKLNMGTHDSLEAGK